MTGSCPLSDPTDKMGPGPPRPRTPSHTIHAPATVDGAQLVHGVLRGDVADPFRRNR